MGTRGGTCQYREVRLKDSDSVAYYNESDIIYIFSFYCHRIYELSLKIIKLNIFLKIFGRGVI